MPAIPEKRPRSDPRQKVTITEIARELNLSTCTISKILNRSFDKVSYAKATILRVEETAKRMGYSPNIHARSLRTNRSMTIGVVMPAGAPYFFGSLVERLEASLRPKGYETIMGHSIAGGEAEKRLVRSLLDRGVDGLIWVPNGKSLNSDDFGLTNSFPLVQLDRPGGSRQFPAVLTDNRAASEALARCIADQGHRDILVLSAVDEDDSLLEREEGVQEVFGNEIERLYAPGNIEASCDAVARSLNLIRNRVLVSLSQPLALGALLAMQRHGLSIGKDVGFASFDNLPLCEIWQPSICRIEQDIDRLCSETVRLLFNKIEGRSTSKVKEIRVPARLIWGTSVPPRSAFASAPKRQRRK